MYCDIITVSLPIKIAIAAVSLIQYFTGIKILLARICVTFVAPISVMYVLVVQFVQSNKSHNLEAPIKVGGYGY